MRSRNSPAGRVKPKQPPASPLPAPSQRRPLPGKWLSRQPDHLHRANDPARILPVNPFKSHRIALLQFRQQLRQRLRLQFGPQSRVRRRRFPQPFPVRLEIKPGAAAKNRDLAARLDFRRRRARQPDKSRRVKRLLQTRHINQMMPHPPQLLRPRFGRADVQSPIDLHGVHGNDLAADPFRQRQGDRRFARRRRAGQKDGRPVPSVCDD